MKIVFRLPQDPFLLACIGCTKLIMQAFASQLRSQFHYVQRLLRLGKCAQDCFVTVLPLVEVVRITKKKGASTLHCYRGMQSPEPSGEKQKVYRRR